MIEKEFYEKVANWDFSQIKYETIKKTKWDFYEEISKYTNENSLDPMHSPKPVQHPIAKHLFDQP